MKLHQSSEICWHWRDKSRDRFWLEDIMKRWGYTKTTKSIKKLLNVFKERNKSLQKSMDIYFCVNNRFIKRALNPFNSLHLDCPILRHTLTSARELRPKLFPAMGERGERVPPDASCFPVNASPAFSAAEGIVNSRVITNIFNQFQFVSNKSLKNMKLRSRRCVLMTAPGESSHKIIDILCWRRSIWIQVPIACVNLPSTSYYILTKIIRKYRS